MTLKFTKNSPQVIPRNACNLACIQLENRLMLSGSVMATLFGDSLILIGDDRSNEIEISVLGEDLVITGIAETQILNNGTTTESVVLEGVAPRLEDICVELGDGDDKVVVRRGLEVSGDFKAKMGRGNDSVGLDQTSIQGKFLANLGTGDDIVSFRETEVAKTVRILGGNGEDTVSLVDSSVNRKFAFFGQQGSDGLAIENSHFGANIFLYANGGQDDFSIASTDIRNKLFVFGGSGSDLVVLESSNARKAFVFLGSGEDTGTVSPESQFDALWVFGGIAQDTFSVGPDSFDFSIESVASQTAIESRLGQPEGLLQRLQAANDIFLPPVGEPDLEISLADPVSNFVVSNDLMLTDTSSVTVEGMTAANSIVEIDADGDGEFDDGLAQADANGSFVVTVDLTEKLNTIEFQVSDRFGRSASESMQIYFAAGTVVQFETSLGSFDVELLNESAPLTTMNFLQYQAAGLYDETVFHRSEVGVNGSFLVQGGGYSLDGSGLAQIDEFNPVQNEFNSEHSNVRGTIALAHPESDLNGGTSQWFINLNDANQVLDDVKLTVFGEIIGSGIEVADAINALETSQIGPVVNEPGLTGLETPLQSYTEFTVSLAGTVSGAANSSTLNGTGTTFVQDLSVGQQIQVGGVTYTVNQIVSETEIELNSELSEEIVDGAVAINSAPSAEQYVVINSVSVLNFSS